MRYLPNGDQMKKADQYTIEELGVPSLVLMERAALETVKKMHENHTDLDRPLIVCGSGNNGGDGFAIARLLKEEGRLPDIYFAGRETSLSEECATQKKIVEKMGIPVFTEFPQKEYTVIIDAVFGVGLSRPVEGRYAEVIQWMNDQNGEKVAIDIPSGICSRTGKVLGCAFRADMTVSMACVKVGCELFPGKMYAGRTYAVSIGIDPVYFQNDPAVTITFDQKDLKHLMPERKQNSHKGSYGKVLMITGSEGMSGAAYLSARAAYQVGAGLVQIFTPESNRTILQQLLPEAIISTYDITEKEDMSEECRKGILAKLQTLVVWADVICLGCGLGKNDLSYRLVTDTIQFIKQFNKPCVIDADGLNIISENMELLEGLSQAVLTPHMKEMSRLIQKDVTEIGQERVTEVEQFVDRYPVVCALKDSRTVVGMKGKHSFINLAGNSAMAKAGSGDVLAGVITGLAAQHLSPYDAAIAGVFLHALGGDRARLEKGAYSVLAADLIEGIGKCLKEMEEIHS